MKEETQPLKTQLSKHFASVKLSEDQAAQLMLLAQSELTHPPTPHADSRKPISIKSSFNLLSSRGFAFAAFVLIALVNTTLWMTHYSPAISIASISDEVARNHLKDHPLDIQSTDLLQIDRYLTKLEFSLAEPQKYTFASFQGGRYCTIAGESAAQIKAIDSQGVAGTLYISDLKAFEGQLTDQIASPVFQHSKGVEVAVWHEKGLIFAFAKEAK